ncbi:THxN family PEP-CTERM protein [Pedomonas mirosovicensis]|uniref:THxN family PEP-CTERM protein n=1 Tax=Pedomonas mirosovicensis TaxID=2908641 RepID=UPI00286EBFF3|nr:THxN family PEP-CTERM protein [Pedomonas mirosovicensis]
MKLKKMFLSAAVAGLCAAVPGMAHAVLINQWDYSVQAEWTSWSPGGVDRVIGVSTDALRWGTPVNGGGRSSLSVTRFVTSEGAGGPDPIITNSGLPQPGITLTHDNFAIKPPTLTNAQLQIMATFESADPNLGVGFNIERVFDIDFLETTNVGPCAVPQSASVCDDVFILQNPEDLAGSFEFDGILYTARLVFDPALFEGGQIFFADFDGDGDNELFFLTEENTTAILRTGILITAQAVPEPAALGLAGAGIAGLGFVVRRRSRKA